LEKTKRHAYKEEKAHGRFSNVSLPDEVKDIKPDNETEMPELPPYPDRPVSQNIDYDAVYGSEVFTLFQSSIELIFESNIRSFSSYCYS